MDQDISDALLKTGHRMYRRLYPIVEPADPGHRLRPDSRELCCGLGLLSASCCAALGGTEEQVSAAERAGALLALLTKIDDEVIDGYSFHGGRGESRTVLRCRTRSYLQPTLDSIRNAQPVDHQARCELAAEAGRAFRDLAVNTDRLTQLLSVISIGWDVQVDAVAVLSATPSSVRESELADVTARISGSWLLMITMVGALPVRQGLTPEEKEAFFTWGAWIQRADALADLEREIRDGFISTIPGWMAARTGESRYLKAVAEEDFPWIYRKVSQFHTVCLPPAGLLLDAGVRLARLGRVPEILDWIHRFLLGRYVSHSRFIGERSAFLSGW